MISIKNNYVNARELHLFVEVKTRFDMWIKRCIEYADLQNGVDFRTELCKTKIGRPTTEYFFTVDAAKEVCIVSATKKSKELRRWLIGLSNQREALELLTIKEAAFAVKVINALKYIDNQKEALSLHQKTFIQERGESNYIYADFAKYRTKINGWTKDKVNEALDEYLQNNSGFNRTKLIKKSMPEKLSVLDVNEAIRVACLDILFAKGEDADTACRFSEMVKKMSAEMNTNFKLKNETNLFESKTNDSVKSLMK